MSKALIAANNNAPHIVNATTVVTSNDRLRWLKQLGRGILPQAYANTIVGLNTIWDPENGSAPSGTDPAVINGYLGSGYTCNGSNQCSGADLPTVAVNISVKDYMGQHLDPNFANSNTAYITPFGRLNNDLQIVCALEFLATNLDADGTPAVGVHTVTFPSSTSSYDL